MVHGLPIKFPRIECLVSFQRSSSQPAPRGPRRTVMPFYDYQCGRCGKTFTERENFEQHQRRRNLKCPGCGSRKTRQLVAAAYVHTSKKS